MTDAVARERYWQLNDVLNERDELRAENERLRAFLTAIEAGFNFHRLSAAEMASEARAALDGALEPLGRE